MPGPQRAARRVGRQPPRPAAPPRPARCRQRICASASRGRAATAPPRAASASASGLIAHSIAQTVIFRPLSSESRLLFDPRHARVLAVRLVSGAVIVNLHQQHTAVAVLRHQHVELAAARLLGQGEPGVLADQRKHLRLAVGLDVEFDDQGAARHG